MSFLAFMLSIILTLGFSEAPPNCDSFEASAKVKNTSGGEQNGSIELTLEGGLGPYSFFWYGESLYILAPGSYCVMIQKRDFSESLEFKIG
jgi:hypothetical protein